MADTEALAELLAERDRLRQVTEMQAATIEQQADSIQKIMEQSERRKEFADRLRAQVEDMRTAVHSCHPGCSNARCVAERLRADVRELVELAAETVNEWDSRIVDGDDYAACKRVIENTMAPLRALLAKHKETK